MRALIIAVCLGLAACANPALPPAPAGANPTTYASDAKACELHAAMVRVRYTGLFRGYYPRAVLLGLETDDGSVAEWELAQTSAGWQTIVTRCLQQKGYMLNASN